MRILSIALVTLLLSSCGGQPLEPWHSVNLDEEYVASMASEVQDFEGYLEVEHQVFEQLMIEVYARVETTPENQLLRYSRGSLSDPETWDFNFNRSFELTAENPRGGILLLHGMSDSPYSLHELGEMLNSRGYWVIGLRLPGHGTAPAALKRVRWLDMASATRLAMEHLSAKVGDSPIHVAGYSTGAALALNLSLDAIEDDRYRKPDSLLLISPAIGISAAAALARPKAALGRAPGFTRLGYTSILPEFDPFRYNSFATNAATQVRELTRTVGRRVAGLANDGNADQMPPILVFKSAVDATVTNDAVIDRLLTYLPDNGNELVLFDINRAAVISGLLVDDPGPFTSRLMSGTAHPFTVRLVGNENADSRRVVARIKPEGSAEVTETVDLGMEWPLGIISLSHIAVPFSPEDPLYGATSPDDGRLFLGYAEIRGERGLLNFSSDWLLRLRHNPFYDVLESRVVEWLDVKSEPH